MPLCVYCQVNEGATADHVPPKGIFGEPRPSNLITVPACVACNQGFGLDDDEFLNLCLEWRASETPGGSAIVPKRVKDMQRPQAQKKWQPFFKKLIPLELRSESGLHVGNTFAMRLDKGRILNTVSRTVRGLFYHVTKRPLPLGVPVTSLLFKDIVEQYRDQPEALAFVNLRPTLPGQDIGSGTFDYRYILNTSDPDSSIWFLGFYTQFAFVCMTGGHEDEGNEEPPGG